jgi:hypothetical protein
MDEKKMSLIILAFIFVVAVPGIIFMFSDSNNVTGQFGRKLVLDSSGRAYDYVKEGNIYNYQRAYPYRQDAGVQVPIYDEDGRFLRYEFRSHTETSKLRYKPAFEDTYSAMRNLDCPKGYLVLSEKKASEYEAIGRSVLKVGDVYCWFPEN